MITEMPSLSERMIAMRPALVRHFTRSLGASPDVEDMVQEVYLRLVRRGELGSYDGFATYVFQVASSVLKDRNRRNVVRMVGHHDDLRPDAYQDTAPGQERQLASRDELRQTSAILAELPERTSAVFLLRRIDGMSYAEIGIRLGISISSAEKHMLKATRHLIAARRGAI